MSTPADGFFRGSTTNANASDAAFDMEAFQRLRRELEEKFPVVAFVIHPDALDDPEARATWELAKQTPRVLTFERTWVPLGKIMRITDPGWIAALRGDPPAMPPYTYPEWTRPTNPTPHRRKRRKGKPITINSKDRI